MSDIWESWKEKYIKYAEENEIEDWKEYGNGSYFDIDGDYDSKAFGKKLTDDDKLLIACNIHRLRYLLRDGGSIDESDNESDNDLDNNYCPNSNLIDPYLFYIKYGNDNCDETCRGVWYKDGYCQCGNSKGWSWEIGDDLDNLLKVDYFNIESTKPLGNMWNTKSWKWAS
jgi:hypothetical protein